MVQNLKSVLICVTQESSDEDASSALGYGLSLAQQAGAHATVQAASVKLVVTSAWMSLAAPLIHAENRHLKTLAEAVAENAKADAAAAGVVCSAETLQLSFPELLASFTALARIHDVTVLDAEPGNLKPDRTLIETLLTKSGRPLIVVPPGQDAFRGRRILIAWDGSAKAARAVADALPLLRAAEAVEVVSVSGEKELPDTITGADIAPHLSRHDVAVSVRNVAAPQGDVAAALRNQVAASRADMIVMGGYVHSRLREMVFGGVTQSLLKESPVPLFMAH